MRSALVLLLWQDDYCGQPGRCSWPRLVVCQALPCAEAAGLWLAGPGHKVAAEPRVVPDLLLTVGQSLVLAQMAAEPGFLDLVLACWWVGPIPDMAGCGFYSIPRLVLAHCIPGQLAEDS